MDEKIAILVSKYNPGVVSMARNLLETTKRIELYYIEDLFIKETLFKAERKLLKDLSISFAQKNLKRLSETYNNHIILGGWSTLHEKLVNILHRNGVKPSIMWCSTLGQMEMTCKMGDYKALLSLLELNEEGKIRLILFNERLYEEMGFIKNSIYFPHTLNLVRFNAYFKDTVDNHNDVFDIDLFAPIRQGKNILSQVSAVKLSNYSNKINLHINFKHAYIDRIIELWKLSLTRHRWLPWHEYLNLISNMHISLQVTHTESFNYAVAERMAMGVPSLVSYNIYNICKDNFLKKYLCVEAIDSPEIIRNKLDFLLKNPSLLKELRRKVHDRINTLMSEKNALAKTLLDKYFQ